MEGSSTQLHHTCGAVGQTPAHPSLAFTAYVHEHGTLPGTLHSLDDSLDQAPYQLFPSVGPFGNLHTHNGMALVVSSCNAQHANPKRIELMTQATLPNYLFSTKAVVEAP